MILYATPKINLGLHVLRKRQDGYHDLETLFYPVHSLWDEISVEPSVSFSIELEGAGWDPQQDLCAKAYALLKEEFPSMPAVSIMVRKGIPVGAGLGGGSADAVQTLMALNSMFGLGLDASGLAERASRLGSDCAFFIYDSPMFAEGRGEILTPFGIDLDDYDIEIEMPSGVHVSTADAYRGVTPREARPTPLRDALSQPVARWKECLENDFEDSVFELHPEVRKLKERMYADGAVYAAMSGSGAAVFGLFR